MVALTMLGTSLPAVSVPAAGPPSSASTISSGRLAGLRYHVLTRGETVATVSRRYGVSVEAIRAANGMTKATWYAGARVLLDAPNPPHRYPGPTPPSKLAGTRRSGSAGSSGSTSAAPTSRASVSTASVSTASLYTVRSGDSLARIARRHGVTVAALVAANGLDAADVIMPGQQLSIPAPGDAGPPPPASGSTSTGSAHTASLYTVRSGDSFARIAKRHGVTVAALVAANGLDTADVITPGQQLSIPTGADGERAAVPAGRGASEVPDLACVVPGSSFSFDWGFPRSGGRFHEGLDMFAPTGTPVLAPVDGTVTTGNSSISGLHVSLTGTDTWHYHIGHLSKLAKRGTVRAGDVIGYVGASGNADGTEPHVHLEMRPLDGRPTNPWPHMRRVCG